MEQSSTAVRSIPSCTDPVADKTEILHCTYPVNRLGQREGPLQNCNPHAFSRSINRCLLTKPKTFQHIPATTINAAVAFPAQTLRKLSSLAENRPHLPKLKMRVPLLLDSSSQPPSEAGQAQKQTANPNAWQVVFERDPFLKLLGPLEGTAWGVELGSPPQRAPLCCSTCDPTD